MTLETEKYDPIKTHWVRIVTGSSETLDGRKTIERELENAFEYLNHQAVKQEMVIIGLSCTPSSLSGSFMLYTIIANIVPRRVIEAQQARQRFSAN